MLQLLPYLKGTSSASSSPKLGPGLLSDMVRAPSKAWGRELPIAEAGG